MPIQYRTWQDEMFELFRQHMEKYFMSVVTPGGGKTIGMLRCAKFSLDTGETDFLIIVVPTDELKGYWKKKAFEEFNIPLFSKYEGWVSDKDFRGVVVTYQQVAKSPDKIRKLHQGRKTFVIFDEPHHMADGKSWGDRAHDALQPCIRGILGTGTPFRTDQYAIPFVEYKPDGELKTHYEYNFDDALIDQVVRALFFRKIGSEATWYSYTEEVVTATFEDELNERQMQERLNAVIDSRSEFVREVFKQAYAEIMHLRKTEQPNAKILVIGKDTTHLTFLAEVWQEVNGNTPVVVSSADEHEGKDAIEAFRQDDTIAIFAVDMISEGVDIPPLRSLVYLTNVTAALYFYQAIGRVARVEPGRELLNGYIYLPSDPRLLALAETIKQRRISVLKEFRVCPRCGEDPCVCPPPPPPPPKTKSMFEMYLATAVYDGGVYDDEVYSETEWQDAETWKRLNGFRIPTEEACKILRRSQQWQPASPEPTNHAPDPEKVRDTLAKDAYKLTNKLATMRLKQGGQPFSQAVFSKTVAFIHSDWVKLHGGKPHKEESIDGLKRKVEWLKNELGNSGQGG